MRPEASNIIVDASYGERLQSLPPAEPAWVADTRVNKPVIERLRAHKCPEITSFRVDLAASSKDWLMSILDQVELHHGEYSQTKPYSELRVIGADLSEELRMKLEAHGFRQFEKLPDGFIANRMPA